MPMVALWARSTMSSGDGVSNAKRVALARGSRDATRVQRSDGVASTLHGTAHMMRPRGDGRAVYNMPGVSVASSVGTTWGAVGSATTGITVGQELMAL